MRKNLYITRSGKLSRRDNTLLFKNDAIAKTIPIIGIENIYLLGEVSVNSKLFAYFAENKIVCHFFNYYGYYTGSFYPRESYLSGKLLVKQVEHYSHITLRLGIAGRFVQGIGNNLIELLRHYYKHGKITVSPITRIRKLVAKISSCKSVPELLQVEGEIWNVFYVSFSKVLLDSFSFKNRVKRPPDNPVNALISFGNSLLYAKVTSKIYHTQLNPSISYLHEPGNARFSLSLDIAEVFKPAITFQTILKLVNKRMLKASHFNQELNYCMLNEDGRRVFVEEFERKLGETADHPRLKRKYSYDGLIKLELYKLVKHLMEGVVYEPYSMERGC